MTGAYEGIETKRLKGALEEKLFEQEPEPVRVGRFVVIDRLGSGGMGLVYRAYDADLDRRVAVKVLLRSPTRNDSSATARLLREARTMAQLNHPNVVTVHEAGVFEGNVFVAMEYVDGGTLEDWMQQHPRPSPRRREEAIELALQAARGLAAAHEAGVVHRDLKPANMLIDSTGRLRIADFGLASSRSPATYSSPSSLGETPGGHTATGSVMGTPAYMAPEQQHGEADARSDQFSFCVSFFEAVYGVAPHAGSTLTERMAKIEAAEVSEPEGGRAPVWLWRLLARGLSPNREDRHPDVASLLAELEAHRRPRRHAAIGLAATGVLAVVAAAAYFATAQEARCGDAASRLGDSWSPERRSLVEEGFAASQLPYSDTTRELVFDTVDAYVRSWSDTYEEACTATWERGEQSERMLDLRMQCLDRGRGALDFVSGTLASGGDDVVRRSVELAQKLPDLEACSDPEVLERRSQGRSLEQDQAAAAAYLLLDQAGVLTDLARYEEAEALLAETTAAGNDHDLPGIVAFSGAQLAQVRTAQGRFDDASRQVNEAIRAAQASRDGDAAVFVYSVRVRLDLNDSEAEPAKFYIGLAEGAMRRGDSPPSREATLAQMRGDLASLVGNGDEAVPFYDRAIEVLRATDRASASTISDLLHSKARSMFGAGHLRDALEVFLESAEVVGRAYGEAHPGQAAGLSGAATTHLQLGETSEALELQMRAYRLLEADPAFMPQRRAEVMRRIADSHNRLGEQDAAMAWLDRAESVFIETFGADHPTTAYVEFSRGNIKLNTTQDFEGAAECFRSVLSRWEGLEALTNEAFVARLNLAIAESKSAQHDRAVVSATAALSEAHKLMSPDAPQMIGYLRSLGGIYRRAGRLAEAKDAYTRAIAISDAGGGEGYRADEARFGLARVLFEEGDRTRAKELALVARSNLAKGGAEKHGELNKIDEWLEHNVPSE